MNSRRQGFTLVELMIVAALSAVVMGAIYQTLIVQQKSNRQINAEAATQQTLRASMQFLQGQLRELGATTGDVEAAAPESVTFRAMRKMGIVCGKPGGRNIDVFTMGDTLIVGDSVLFFADLGDKAGGDDTIRIGRITASNSGGAVCTRPTGLPWDSLSMGMTRLTVTLLSGSFADVSVGDVVRTFEKTTYGIFSKGGSYVLGRRGGAATDTVVKVIGPLASPASGGLRFQYFDTASALPSGTLSAANRARVFRIRMTLRGSTPGAGSTNQPTYSDTLVTNIYLRGNA